MSTFFLLALILSQLSPGVQSGKPAEVRGHITGLKDLSGLPITLYSPERPALQTTSRADGSFEFVNVSTGSYTLRAPGFTTVDLTVDGNNLNVDLKPIYAGTGATVGGKVTDRSPAAVRTSRTVTLSPLFSGPTVTGG